MYVCYKDYGTGYIRECPAYYPSERHANNPEVKIQTELQSGWEHYRTALL